MQHISPFQIYATLIVMTIPIAFLEVPKRQLVSLGNNAWIAIALSLLPGLLILFMYMFIIRRSQTPFPLCWKNTLVRWQGASCRSFIL